MKHYAESHNAERLYGKRRHAECRYTECYGAITIKLTYGYTLGRKKICNLVSLPVLSPQHTRPGPNKTFFV
jgi:hypothetical protein